MRRGLACLVALLAEGSRSVTVDEARCILRNKHVTFLGDSVTRYCFFGLNTWLSTGQDREEFDDAWGFGEDSTDYDDSDRWTSWQRLAGTTSKHQQYFTKEHGGTRLSFYFLQDAWFDDGDTDGEKSLADVAARVAEESDAIVYHHTWWPLKTDNGDGDDCGVEFTAACEADFRTRVDTAVEEILLRDDAVVGILRTSTCCGQEDAGWVASIEAQNDIARDVAAARSVAVVDAYPLFGEEDLDEVTFDGVHPDVATCRRLDEMLLVEIDRASGTGCLAADYEPTYEPTTPYAPTYAPTYEPTRTTYRPSYGPTYGPTAGSASRYPPTYGPTPRPVVDAAATGYAPTPRPVSSPGTFTLSR